MFSDAILYPTFKALYRIALDDMDGTPVELWRTRSGRRPVLPDRLGNIVANGAHVWSVTPSRIVLFSPE